MSKERKEKITCPECGQVHEITIWDSLNGDLDPEAKNKLLNGTLFRFQCTKCDYQSNLQYSILYHDMQNNAMVYFVHPDAVDETIKNLAEWDEKIDIKMDGYRKRVVCDQNELREKAIIFDNGLDDRVVEIIKLMYLANAQDQHPDNKVSAIYLMVNGDELSLQFLAEQPMVAPVPREFYNKVAREFSDRIEAAGNSFLVDLAWAKEAISKK